MAASVLDLSRAGDSDLAGAVSEIAAPPGLDAGKLVTAVRTAEGTLQLIVWRVDPSGAVTRLGDSSSQAGAATSVDIAKGTKYVTSCRTADGTLQLITWDVAADGATTRRGDSGRQAGAASIIRIAAVSADLFVTAGRTAGGNLEMISWRVAAAGSVERLNDSGDAGAVSEIALLVHRASAGGGRLVTAVRDGDGDLKLIVWGVTSAGSFSRLSDSGAQAGAATLIRVAHDVHGNVVTAVRDGDGDLKLITWRIGSEGLVTRLKDSGNQAGAIGDNALAAHGDGVVSAVRTAPGSLRLIAWSTTAAGVLTRRSDSAGQAGAASLIEVVPGDGTPDSAGRSVSTVTAVRTAAGALKLITWGPTCIRLHVKILTSPNLSINTMLTAMRQVYATVGIAVRLVSTETLNLPALNDVDVDSCNSGTTAEQDDLYANRNNVERGDVVVYFVRATVPPLNGCATHPDGRPGAVVTRGATKWTLGHEVGHVLGLNHVRGTDRLMTGGGTANITHPPPDLVPAEVSRMQGSTLTDECTGG